MHFKNLFLSGTSNVGKTTTLITLIIKLLEFGNCKIIKFDDNNSIFDSKIIINNLKNEIKPKKKPSDHKIVLKAFDKLICICTGGDAPDVLERNIKYSENGCEIFVSACRTTSESPEFNKLLESENTLILRMMNINQENLLVKEMFDLLTK